MKKKILYILYLMIALSFCALTAEAKAEYRPYREEEYTIVDNVVYELDYDKKAKEKFYKVIEFFATNESAESAVKVSIKSEIDGIPVREIRGITGDIEFVQAYCEEESYPNVKSISIPDSVVKIGRAAFASLDGVERLSIPDSVTSISDYACSGMESLKTVKLSSNIIRISRNLFSQCTKLTYVKNMGKITVISEDAFNGCTSLKSFKIPSTVREIRERAFKNCKKLTKVYNTDNVTLIEDEAFRSCKALTAFTVSPKVTKIGEKAFYGCTKLKKVTVNSKKKAPEIGKKAFGKTAESIKFTAKNSSAAKSWKSALKKSGLKKMTVGYTKFVKV